MRPGPLIAVLSACSPASTTPANKVQPPAPAETLWDKGTFIVVDKAAVLPDTEESFEIYRRAEGYRIVVRWKRPAPTGEKGDGEVTLFTDEHFSPVQGKMTSTLHTTDGDQLTVSTITRAPDGRLVSEVTAYDGSKDSGASKQPNDWYVGGTITTVIVALCQADASITAPIVYPDKVTSLAPLEALPIDGTQRRVQSRILTYEQSKRQIIAACENGKLAGEATRGGAIVRTGDLALAHALEQLR